MKYRIIIITILLGFLASCEKEISSNQEEKFMKFYGNYLIDQATGIDVLDNGGFAICGTDSTAEDGKQMVLIVTDSYGNIQNGFPKYFTKEDPDSGSRLKPSAEDRADICSLVMWRARSRIAQEYRRTCL